MPDLERGYMILPTFVKCPDRSAYEGETMHKVGDLEPRGDYHASFAVGLMIELVEEFKRRAPVKYWDEFKDRVAKL